MTREHCKCSPGGRGGMFGTLGAEHAGPTLKVLDKPQSTPLLIIEKYLKKLKH